MTDEPLTYGPDMFASDVSLPDPATVLNEPLPRAWTQGGMIEAVKRAVITGLRSSFGNSSLTGGDQKFYIDIEYPTEPTSYPGIWVQFSIANLTRAGLSMETWTKDDDGNWGSIQEWSFNGNITLTVAALTSKDRDRLSDTVIAQLAFARPPDLIIYNPKTNANQMKGLITALDQNPYVSMTVKDQPGVLSSVAAEFGKREVSIAEVRQEGIVDDEGQPCGARIVVVTHRATDAALSDTVAALSDLDAVQQINSVLRLEGTSE